MDNDTSDSIAIPSGLVVFVVGIFFVLSLSAGWINPFDVVRQYGPGSGPVSGPPYPDPTFVASQIEPALVEVLALQPDGLTANEGTGMLLTPDGTVITNHHVIDGTTSVLVTVPAMGQQFDATVVRTDPDHDIAILALAGASGLPTITPGNASSVRRADAVLAIGDPGGAESPFRLVTGTVQGTGRSITASDSSDGVPHELNGLIETNVPLEPGYSGGPLLNTAGQVIGINTAGSSLFGLDIPTGTSYAVPIDLATALA
ncbi:MAG: S1C family serine protease [Acidimicrobiia bacterium]